MPKSAEHFERRRIQGRMSDEEMQARFPKMYTVWPRIQRRLGSLHDELVLHGDEPVPAGYHGDYHVSGRLHRVANERAALPEWQHRSAGRHTSIALMHTGGTCWASCALTSAQGQQDGPDQSVLEQFSATDAPHEERSVFPCFGAWRVLGVSLLQRVQSAWCFAALACMRRTLCGAPRTQAGPYSEGCSPPGLGVERTHGLLQMSSAVLIQPQERGREMTLPEGLTRFGEMVLRQAAALHRRWWLPSAFLTRRGGPGEVLGETRDQPQHQGSVKEWEAVL
ncbi:hypothetical protein NDU88_000324 [Pleurodeles waltl]|uniref:Uncharacterized protein n=1 Tax=Pleurodeles waltl TaxID=8319 RepID=A0AAV7L9M5_PLEWA|nr:hypothetical protein NDU88_000324 [Pleurodeles waltl]